MRKQSDFKSSFAWYGEEGYTVPRLEVLGPYIDSEEKEYVNLILHGSDWRDPSGRAEKTAGTFRREEIIALRDHLNDMFPSENDWSRAFAEVAIEDGDEYPELEDDDLEPFRALLEEDDAVELEISTSVEQINIQGTPRYMLEQDPFTDDWVVYEVDYDEIASFKRREDAVDYIESNVD